jgi:hypothetical protein
MMEQVSGRSFSGEDVETDGRSFADCSFESAELVYRGGDHPLFERCTFGTGVRWRFLGPALTTIQLLQRIANEDGGETFIGQLFAKGVYFEE